MGSSGNAEYMGYQIHQITKKTRLTTWENNSEKSYFINSTLDNSQQLSTWVLALVPAPAPATVARAANAPLAGIKSTTAGVIPTMKHVNFHAHSVVCFWECDGKLVVGKKMKSWERESELRRHHHVAQKDDRLWVFLPLDDRIASHNQANHQTHTDVHPFELPWSV